MADTTAPSCRARADRPSRRSPPPMSPKQLQAYLLARGTLRRLKSAAAACVPPNVPLGARAGS